MVHTRLKATQLITDSDRVLFNRYSGLRGGYITCRTFTTIVRLFKIERKKNIYWTAHTSNTYIQEVTKTEINT
jgi:hypothetical protein